MLYFLTCSIHIIGNDYRSPVAAKPLWPPQFLTCQVYTKGMFQLQVRLKNPHNNNNMLTHFCQPNAAEAAANAVKHLEHQSHQPICSTISSPTDRVNEERIKKLEQRVSQLIKKVHD